MTSAISRGPWILILATSMLSVPGCGESPGASSPDVVHELFYTQTADQVSIAVHRYVSSNGPNKAEPVFLSQGFIEADRGFSTAGEHTLVRTLVVAGYEVWTYDLRNTGQSQKSEIGWDELYFDLNFDWSTGFDLDYGMTGWSYGMDHFVLYDTPAALDLVLAVTGKPQVLWISHSMGAVMQYAALETSLASKVKAAVSLGGIGYFKPGSDYGVKLSEALGQSLIGDDPIKWALGYALSGAQGKLVSQGPGAVKEQVYSFLKSSYPETSPACFFQYAEWVRKGDCRLAGVKVLSGFKNPGFPTAGGRVAKNYSVTKNLDRIKTPMLVVSGGADFLCPPALALGAYSRISSMEKKYIELSVSTGHAADYGHTDMVLGLRAPDEVFPHVLKWIGSYATKP